MLLRSSSTPALNSWLPHCKEPSFREQQPEMFPKIPKSRPISLLASSPSPLSLSPTRMMTRAVSEADLRDFSLTPLRKAFTAPLNGFEEREEEGEETGMAFASDFRRTMSLGLTEVEGCEAGLRDNKGLLGVLAEGGVGGGGGKICGGNGGGGGGSDDGGEGDSGFWESNHGGANTDTYYQKMIDTYPGNPMLLGNYARFLKETRGDLEKAEEYCGRAILASPNDGSFLSMFADLIWQLHKDAPRAQTYYDQAVQAAPDDSYVLASYAKFLWDSEDEEEVEDENRKEGGNTKVSTDSTPNVFHGIPPPPSPLALAA